MAKSRVRMRGLHKLTADGMTHWGPLMEQSYHTRTNYNLSLWLSLFF
uniref:Alternative protein NUDCD1 n=1 Tax=Homo sapiens TaxID=9606 RepID=L8E919_HUMAN|nr:alternative protein NUDCD1 [Homo sapiens]